MLDFLSEMIGSRPIEIIAVCCGLVNVTLVVKRSIWNYPFGIVMVSLYAKIFYEHQLYSDAILQIYFFFFQFYGLYYWLKGKSEDGKVVVNPLSPKKFQIYLAFALIFWVAWSYTMGQLTDASFPYWDGAIAVLSMLAQFLLARKHLENWYLWIVVNILAIGLFTVKDLQPTAALYCVFLVLSIIGLVQWRRSLVLQTNIENKSST